MADLLRERYEPLDELGRGGEARVVRARDHQLGRTVALKIRPSPDIAIRDELLREARVLTTLEPHPGLPLVRDDFFTGSDYVIVMDWVEGIDLERLLREQGTPGLAPSTVLRHLAQVAEALTYLHAHDPAVVHGDVKPANIVLTGRDKAVLVDFGLAASGADRAQLGTPGFVAPEVAAGQPPTPASDIYSLAMTAYTLLTGDVHPGGRPLWPDSLGAERARAFERAVRLGTSTDPDKRPSSAGEFLEELRGGWESDVPTGVVTFVMTDIEGSTALWDAHPKTMPGVLARHDAVVASVVESRRGRVLKSMGEGDSTVSVFIAATDAVPAAAEIVRALAVEPWPDGIEVNVRVGAHTGEADRRAGDFFGPAINLAARVRAEADGKQVFLSGTTARLVQDHLPEGFGLVDLGPHTLRGLASRENIVALSAPFLRTPPDPGICPYRGLLAYESTDEGLFFGRDDVVQTIIHRLSDGAFLGIVGASGSGKSSILRAGVMAAAARGSIAGVTSASLITPTSDGTLADAAGGDPAGLLVVDQFEELFTMYDDESARASFVERLLARTGKTVVSIRADFYGHCAGYPALADKLTASQILLGPMRRSELRQVVEAPARAAGLRLEGGLAELILADAAGEPGALPLLSHALLETWARRDGRTLTIAAYSDAGGVGRAIAQTAEKAFESFSDEEQKRARNIFLRLTELGEGTEDSSRRVRSSELRPHDTSDRSVRSILERLTLARLITVDGETVQVAHEALIREWPRLRGWLNEDRERLRLQRDLTRAVQTWDELDRDPGALYRGARLAAVLEWPDHELSIVEHEFTEASRDEQDRELRQARRQAKRLRRRLAGLALALIVAIIAASVAVVQRSNARDAATLAQSGRLAELSRTAASTHPDLGLLLALEANGLRDSVDTEGALLGALEHAMAIYAQLGGFDSPPFVTFSPDGETLAAVGLDGTRLFDVAKARSTGAPLRSSGSGWGAGSFSPDGATIAVPNEQGSVELWNVASRSQTGELRSPDGAWLQHTAYSPDGRLLAAGGREISHITLWDARSRKLLGAPIATRAHPEERGTGPIAFSPDSRLIAASGDAGRLEIYGVPSTRAGRTTIAVANAPVSALAFSPDRRTIAAGDEEGDLSIFDVRTRERIGRRLSVGATPVASIAYSPDGRLVAAGSFKGSVFVWDTATGIPFGPRLDADTIPVESISFSPDGRLLASAHRRTVVLWDMSGRRAIGEPLGDDTAAALGAAFSPDGRELALAGYDGTVRIHDPRSRAETTSLAVGSPVLSVAYSPNGRLLAAAGVEGKVHLWEASTKASIGTLDAGNAWIWQVAFSPDARLLAAAVDPNGPRDLFNPDREGEIQLWDVATRGKHGKPMIPGKRSVASVAFSPDGRRLVSGSGEERAQLWDVATQMPFGRAMDVVDDGMLALAYAPDGKRVATAGAAVVRLWDAARQRLAVPPLTGHTGLVAGAAYDPKGRFLATTDLTGATRLWDPTSGAGFGEELLAPKPASLAPQIDLRTAFLPLRPAFSPDGSFLAVAGLDSRVTLWDLRLSTWKARACAIAGRNLSRTEWTRYLPAGTSYRRTCSAWPAGASE